MKSMMLSTAVVALAVRTNENTFHRILPDESVIAPRCRSHDGRREGDGGLPGADRPGAVASCRPRS